MPCTNDGYPPDTSQRDELNKVTALLCYACSIIFGDEKDSDSTDTTELHSWYEQHKAEDRRRAEEQRRYETKKATKARLLKQLTPEELDALDIR